MLQQLVPADATRELVITSSRRQTRPDQLQAPTYPNTGAFPSTAPIIDFQRPSQRASSLQSDGSWRHKWIRRLFSSNSGIVLDSYDVNRNKVQDNSSQVICRPQRLYKRVTCVDNTIGSHSHQYLGVDADGMAPTV